MRTEPIQELQNPDSIVRQKTVLRLMAARDASESVCIALANALADEDQDVRELAAEALWSLRCRFPVVKPRILFASQDPSRWVREFVIRALAAYPADEEIAKTAIPLMSDPDLLVRIRAAQLVSHFCGSTAVVNEVIEQGLLSEDVDCLVVVCQLLTELGASQVIHLPELVTLTKHRHGAVRANALYAIARCSPDDIYIRRLAESMVEDTDPLVQFRVSEILVSIEC